MKATKTLAAKLVSTMIGLGALTLGTTAMASDDGDHEDRLEAPEWVHLRNISYAGSGCPAGSVSDNRSEDGQSLDILWDSFTAETGLGIPLSQSRKNCQINVDLDYPRGWSYTVEAVNLGGYVSLEHGVSAQVKTAYYFQGQAETARLETNFRGPTNRDFQIQDSIGQGSEVWSPCGAQRSLNVNFAASVASHSQSRGGLITLESSSSPLFTLRWKRCY